MKPSRFSHCFLAILAVALFCATGCTKRAKANRHLQRANAYFAASQYDRAEIEYLNVMRFQPTNTVALRNLAEIYYVNDSIPRAAAFLGAVKQRQPNDAESRGKLARLLLGNGARKEAMAEADAVLQLSPTNENAVIVLVESTAKPEEISTNAQRIARLQQKAGDHAIFHIARGLLAGKARDAKTAENEFKTALTLEPKSPLANFVLGGFYADIGSNAVAEPFLKAASDLSPIRSQNRLRYATFKAQTSGIDAAKPIVSEVTSKAPDYSPGWLLAARLAINQTNYTECTADLKRVLDRDGANFSAVMMLSDVQSGEGKFDEAVKTLDKLTQTYPKSPLAHYQLGLACLRAKDQARGLSALNQAVALDPLYAPAVLGLSELNIRRGETAGTIDALTRLIKARPQTEQAYVLLGAAYSTAGRYNDALTSYNELIQKFPRNAQAPYLIGITLNQQGRPDEARKVFEKLLQTNPEDRMAIMELVALDLQTKNMAGAEQRLKGWMEKAPQNPDPVFELAKLRYSQKDFKGAEALLDKVLALNKDAVGAYILLGRIYYDSNQIDSALEKTKTALAKNPNDTGALLLTGIIYENKKDYNSARDTYEKLLSINPQNIVALNNLATVYAEYLNQVEKGYPLARKAQELAPTYPAIADTFGWILSLRGEYEPALALLKEASRQQPNEPEILGHLGITQYLDADEAGARVSLQNALKLSPAFGRRDQVEKYLAFLNITPATADANTIALLEKRLAEAPTDPVALARLSAVYENTGKIDKAIAIYEKALATNPKLAIAAARLAELNARNNNFDKALDLAKNARKLDSSDPQIAHIAGRVATKSPDLKDQQWGLSLLQESSQKNASDPQIAYDLAWAYLAQGRLADADTSMKAALAAGADFRFAAEAKRFLEFLPLIDPVRATQEKAKIDQALQADPNFLPALAGRAMAAQQSGDAATALKTYDQILARYPGFAPAMRNYVVLSAGQSGDTAKAWNAATRARETYRDDPEFNRAYGILQYQRADYQAAARTLSDAAKKRPNDETIQYYLGMSHYQLKQPKETKVALKKAIDLQPKAPFASEVQRILAELK